ncbi:exonuclease SbcCD subunit D [Streptomyces lonarensis]|uniref:Nuclease SbcCD subunit D n=1 Tax=Streptomyces lonarensis TaxID=700599 RepID=A0A7X6CXE4_9ACTN|nr:exonuclease SbcCD subunit D [Streptomyces lonarensis]NJQ04344.1 exonuclease SbcCD subunit D [Streptomyces lonarensis]
MRLLHTSDWHLGRGLHRVPLLDAQRDALEHLVAVAVEHQVDAVLVAGDVYDRAVPPLSAVRLYDELLHRLADHGVAAVIISGNHDSPHRLGVAAGLIGRAGVHLRTDPADCDRPVLLEDAHGTVAVYGIPYLEPALARAEFGVERAGHREVLGAAADRIRADLATRGPGVRSVVLSHAFVTGGVGSDSERDITAGGAAAVPASLFDGFDYTALGHLHGAQTISDRVRYSGSPLAYSFSEAAHRKSMWLIELGPDGELAAQTVPHPVPRPLGRIRGRIDDLLADPAHEGLEQHWLEATLTDPARPEEPMPRLRARFPHLISLVLDPDPVPGDGATTYAQRLRGRTDREIAADFVRHVRPGSGPSPAEAALLDRALEAARVDTPRGGPEEHTA